MPNVFTQVELDDNPAEITEAEGKKTFLHESEIEETNAILIKEDKSKQKCMMKPYRG